MTIEKLTELGADTKEGLARCAGMEAFYLNLVTKAIQDDKYGELENLIAEIKGAVYDKIMEGVLANLALKPILDPICEITEGLRARTEMDYSGLVAQMKDARSRFLEDIF